MDHKIRGSLYKAFRGRRRSVEPRSFAVQHRYIRADFRRILAGFLQLNLKFRNLNAKTISEYSMLFEYGAYTLRISLSDIFVMIYQRWMRILSRWIERRRVKGSGRGNAPETHGGKGIPPIQGCRQEGCSSSAINLTCTMAERARSWSSLDEESQAGIISFVH